MKASSLLVLSLTMLFSASMLAQTITTQKHFLKSKVQSVKKPANKINNNLQAIEKTVIHSNSNIFNLQLSAKLNQAGWYVDDGGLDKLFLGNNNNIDSRFKITGTAKATNDLTIFTKIEVGLRNSSSNVVSQTTPTSLTTPLRVAEIGVTSKRFGKLSLGQGPTASDRSAEVDLSGTEVAGYSGIQKMGGGILFRNSATGLLSAISVGSAFNNLDGLGREGRVRYDTPQLSGFSMSTSLIGANPNDELQGDIVLRYHHKLSQVEIGGALAYIISSLLNSTVPGHSTDGSLSILLANGLNVTEAAGIVDAKMPGRKDPNYSYTKLGYQVNCNRLGVTAFSVDYGKFNNYVANMDKAQTYGADIVQHIKAWKTQLYVGYRHLKLLQSNASYYPINLVLAGAMIDV